MYTRYTQLLLIEDWCKYCDYGEVQYSHFVQLMLHYMYILY